MHWSDSLKNISFLMRSDDRVFITQNKPRFEDLRVSDLYCHVSKTEYYSRLVMKNHLENGV